LNGRERIETALELGEPDYVPIMSGMDALVAKVAGKTVREYYSDPDIYVSVNISARKRFGFDEIFVWWPHVLPEAMGAELIYPENDYPTIKSPLIKTVDDVDRLTIPDPQTDGRLPSVLKAIANLDRKVGDQACICGSTYGLYTEMGNLLGFERLLIETLKKGEILTKLAKKLLEAKTRFGEAMAEVGCRLIWMSEPMASPPILSVDTYENAVLPAWNQLTKVFKKAGAYTFWHPCGRTKGEYPILEQLLRGEADAISFSETTDLRVVKEKFAGKKCVAGNIDPLKVGKVDTERVKREAQRIVEDTSKGGGFIFTPGCTIPLNTPLENIEAMITSVRKYGRYR
jgi:uroporphyrinogen decarboxylase